LLWLSVYRRHGAGRQAPALVSWSLAPADQAGADGKPWPVVSRDGSGRLQNKCEMKSILEMDPRVRDLVMLSALAALGCGLAAVQGGLLFVAIFCAAHAPTIIPTLRPFFFHP